MVFGLPGGAILPLYGVLHQYPQLRHILVRHEQAAVMAADGYARATGQVGVCMATSGPGATNLATGLACAQMDSIPIVAITGQVARPAIGKDAFQETDVTGITLPITKHNYLVMDPAEIAPAIKEAFYIANTGRPGPVLVDIPKDVLATAADFVYPSSVDLPGYKPNMEGHPAQIRKAVNLISEAKRPVILAGHGITISRAFEEVQELAEKAQIPVITTLLGISSFPSDHFLNVGMPGMHGMAYASLALDQSDLIISLGARFDDRVTGRLSAFAPNAKVIHIDIDPSEISKNVKATVPIVGDLKRVLQAMVPQVESADHTDWIKHIEQMRLDHPSLKIRGDQQAAAPVHPEETLGGHRQQGDNHHGCWPAPDVGGPALLLQGAQPAYHLRRVGRHGFRGSRRPGRKGGKARQDRLVHRGGRRLPDDVVRPGDGG